MKDKIDIIIDETLKELNSAVLKWTQWPTDPLHAKAVLDEEVGELEQAILQNIYENGKSDIADIKKEAIQVSAMILRFLISLDDYEFKESKMHSQTLDV